MSATETQLRVSESTSQKNVDIRALNELHQDAAFDLVPRSSALREWMWAFLAAACFLSGGLILLCRLFGS